MWAINAKSRAFQQLDDGNDGAQSTNSSLKEVSRTGQLLVPIVACNKCGATAEALQFVI
jgi:hypothetical protein